MCVPMIDSFWFNMADSKTFVVVVVVAVADIVVGVVAVAQEVVAVVITVVVAKIQYWVHAFV